MQTVVDLFFLTLKSLPQFNGKYYLGNMILSPNTSCRSHPWTQTQIHQSYVFLAVCRMGKLTSANPTKYITDLTTLHNIDQSTKSLKKTTTHPHKSPKTFNLSSNPYQNRSSLLTHCSDLQFPPKYYTEKRSQNN